MFPLHKGRSGSYICGIFGSPNITPSVRQMLPFIGLAMQSRGHDSWGASDGTDVIKHSGELMKTWAEAWPAIAEWPAGIFHTRGASSPDGRTAEANAHPFVYHTATGEAIIGIHNGVVSNHEDLGRTYARKYTVDSQHLWMHRAEGRTWEDVRGWGNLAWWQSAPSGTRCIHLLRFNSAALEVCQLVGGEFIFCSLRGPVEEVAQLLGNPVRIWFQIKEYYHYWFEADEKGVLTLWIEGTKWKFAADPPPVRQHDWNGHRHHTPTYIDRPPGHHRKPEELCFKCANTTLVDPKVSLLCRACMILEVEKWRGSMWTAELANRGHGV